jgi:hypothetical protein
MRAREPNCYPATPGLPTGIRGSVAAMRSTMAQTRGSAQYPQIAGTAHQRQTVEANLTRIYPRLGLRGRVDLARRSPG